MKTLLIELMQRVQIKLLSKGLGCHINAGPDGYASLYAFYAGALVGTAGLHGFDIDGVLIVSAEELKEWLECIN